MELTAEKYYETYDDWHKDDNHSEAVLIQERDIHKIMEQYAQEKVREEKKTSEKYLSAWEKQDKRIKELEVKAVELTMKIEKLESNQ